MSKARFDVWVGRIAATAGIIYVALASVWPLIADAQEDGVTAKSGAPYFFVNSDDPATDRLPLKSTTVDVKIAGVIADVVVTQRYRNQGKRPIEARYVFPGGTRAAVYAMNVHVGDRVLTANIREKQAARVEYDTAKAQGRTAALLEQHRPNVFEMNVANIIPGDDVAVELHYTELIVPVEGKYQFVFPTVVGPRYNGSPATGSGTTEPWISMPILPEGQDSPATFDLHVALASPIGVREVSSNTHALDVKRDTRRNGEGGSERVDIALAKQGVTNNRDFVLDYRLAGKTIQSGVLLDHERDENFFLAMIEPPQNVAPTLIVPREYIFVLDISGSMHGYPLETAKALLKKLIGGLRASDTFNVLTFSGDNSILAPRSLPATEGNVALALQVIERQHGGGSTELIPALKRALTIPKDADRSRTMVVVTDGYVTVEREAFDLVRKNLGNANLFAFGIGSSVNRLLIEGLARAGQGEPFIVTQQNEAAAEAERFRKMIEAPLLTQVKLRFEKANDGSGSDFEAYDVEPTAIGDLFAARPVIVFGKWRGKPGGRLVIEGLTANGNYRGSVDLATEDKSGSDQHDDYGAVRYLWARHRIASLTDQQKLDGSQEQAQAITALGLRYNLLTQYTSFVAVDKIVRTTTAATPAATSVSVPSPLPAGVSNLAVGAEVPATPEPPLALMMIVALLVLGAAALALRQQRVAQINLNLG
jgi:Ca-activated chloride channel family protein